MEQIYVTAGAPDTWALSGLAAVEARTVQRAPTGVYELAGGRNVFYDLSARPQYTTLQPETAEDGNRNRLRDRNQSFPKKHNKKICFIVGWDIFSTGIGAVFAVNWALTARKQQE